MPLRRLRSSTRPASRIITLEHPARRMMEQAPLRIVCVCAFFSLCFLSLSARLVEVTLVGGGDIPFKRLVTEPELILQANEKTTHVAQEISKAARRDIVDRNGNLLATSVATASLVANPTLIRNPEKVAKELHKILQHESEKELLQKISKQDTRFMYVRRHLNPREQEAIHNLGIPGLFFEPDTRRVYPYGGLLSHVLGFVDIDNKGIAGMEQYFDSKLRDGGSEAPMQLSVDLRWQSVLREELKTAMQKFSAIGATGVVVDVQTGEVLAMTNLPEFDPHDPGASKPEARFNRASLGAYEMGSTFKAITIAAALDENVIDIKDGYDARHPIHMAGFTINDTHPKNRWLSVPEIFAYSSNIGMAKMALDLGAKRQKEMMHKLGMDAPVKIELPEISKPLLPANWGELATMTISYGHGISVSPLHLVQGITSLVNGGHHTHLTLLKGGNDKRDTGSEVVSEVTSQKMRKLMRTVVQYGTGGKADVAGYRVGGKTGTAEKISAGGHYNENARLASFIGTFPVDNPRYVILAMLDEPQGTKDSYGFATGGWVAAPVVANVVNRMAPMLGIQPVFEAPNTEEARRWAERDHPAPAIVDTGNAVHETSFHTR